MENIRFFKLPAYLSLIGTENQDPSQKELTSAIAVGEPHLLQAWLSGLGLVKFVNGSKLFGHHVDLTDDEIAALEVEPESFSAFRKSKLKSPSSTI